MTRRGVVAAALVLPLAAGPAPAQPPDPASGAAPKGAPETVRDTPEVARGTPEVVEIDRLLRGAAPAEVPRQVRLHIVARRSAVLGSPMTGRITELSLRDGDRFREGQVLARFDCAREEAALARARAGLSKRRSVAGAQARLGSFGGGSAVDQAVSAAEAREAEAEVQAARAFQHIAEGQPLLDAVDDGELEAELSVPSAWAAWLRPGQGFEAAIDETGRGYTAKVTRLGGRVDPVSRSMRVYAGIEAPAGDLLVGMSGQADLVPPPR